MDLCPSALQTTVLPVTDGLDTCTGRTVGVIVLRDMPPGKAVRVFDRFQPATEQTAAWTEITSRLSGITGRRIVCSSRRIVFTSRRLLVASTPIGFCIFCTRNPHHVRKSVQCRCGAGCRWLPALCFGMPLLGIGIYSLPYGIPKLRHRERDNPFV